MAFFAKGYDGMTMILIVWYCGVRRPQRALRSWPGLLLRLGCGKRSFMDFCLPLPSNRCRWSLADIWSFVDTMELESQGLHSLSMNFRCASQGTPLFRHSMNMVGNSCCLSWFCLLALFLLNCGLLCFNIL